jgi:hypothetical protein
MKFSLHTYVIFVISLSSFEAGSVEFPFYSALGANTTRASDILSIVKSFESSTPSLEVCRYTCRDAMHRVSTMTDAVFHLALSR